MLAKIGEAVFEMRVDSLVQIFELVLVRKNRLWPAPELALSKLVGRYTLAKAKAVDDFQEGFLVV